MFFFELGVVVFWNMTEMEEKSIIAEIKNFEIRTHGTNFDNDDINYQGKSQFFIKKDNNKFDEEFLDAKIYITRDHLKLIVNFF